MNYQVLALRIETIFKEILCQDIGYLADDIRLHPYKEINNFFNEVKKAKPEKEKVLDEYLSKHHGMGSDSIDTLVECGYDIEQAITDLEYILKPDDCCN